jgi:hypothetical protein
VARTNDRLLSDVGRTLRIASTCQPAHSIRIQIFLFGQTDGSHRPPLHGSLEGMEGRLPDRAVVRLARWRPPSRTAAFRCAARFRTAAAALREGRRRDGSSSTRRTPSTRLSAGGQALPPLWAASGKLSRHVADHLNQMPLGIRPNVSLQASSDGVHPPVLSPRLWN